MAGLSLVEPSGQPAPCNSLPGCWSDGSVKWMLLDFILGPVDVGQGVWSLQMHQEKRRRSADPNGRFAWRKPIERSWSTPDQPLSPSIARSLRRWPRSRSMICRSWIGIIRGRCSSMRRAGIADPMSSGVSSKRTALFGPRCVSRGLSRVLVGNAVAFRLGSPFFSGLSLARIELTLHNPRRARHRGGLWDLGDPGSYLLPRSVAPPRAGGTPEAVQLDWDEAGRGRAGHGVRTRSRSIRTPAAAITGKP